MNAQSPAWRLSPADVQRFSVNALIFLGPVALIYLPFVASNLADGLQWADFAPNAMVLGAMVLYLVNTLMDFFRKLSAGPKP